MILSVQIENLTYGIDIENPLDISIPMKFNDEQPNAYGVPKASSTPCKSGDLVGDTRSGGSCNFEQYKFIPHCNGTHTECVGHIMNERISVRDCLKDAFIPTALISVEAEKAGETEESYVVDLNLQNPMITRKAIENAFHETLKSKSSADNPMLLTTVRYTDFLQGLIVRTLPNDEAKLVRKYGKYIPPFFSNEAMDFIVEIGVKHLLVDLPSIDRIFDEGKLSNHRKFWNVDQGKFETNQDSRINNTITELIYVPDKIKDGKYLLNLQIAAFESDTSPSRPILFSLD